MTQKIPITPITVWANGGNQVATFFEVRYVNYLGPTASADCHLWTTDGCEVGASIVTASAEQCAEWRDDSTFARVLAENAGLEPCEPPAE